MLSRVGLNVFLFVMFAFLSTPALATKEGALSWTEFSIRSAGTGDSGPVEISGTQTVDGIRTLQIFAFGRRTSMTESQLSALHGFSFNSLQLSYTSALTKHGSKRLYIQVTTGFTSGPVRSKIIEIDGKGAITVSTP